MFRFAICKRAISVTLAALMIFAAVCTGMALAGAETKGQDLLSFGQDGSVKLSSAVLTNSDAVFTGVMAEQNEVGKLTVRGNVDVSAYSGNIAVRIGTDMVKSQIFGVTPDANGNFEATFVLNSFFCKEFGNSIPVTVCYGDKELVLGTVGVVIYDFETGILTYPENTYYINNTEQQAKLTTEYVPADALLTDGKVTVFFESKIFSFVPNALLVAETPAKGNDGVYKQIGVDTDSDGVVDYIKALLNVTAGRQYAVIEVVGSIGADYGVAESDWVDAAEAAEFSNLVPGHKYTFWMRAKADGNKLASAPVYLGSVIAMDSEEASAINAFLGKYDELAANGHTLYPFEVSATVAEIEELIRLYDELSDEAKLGEDIVGKNEHFAISYYIAKYQDILDAAANATVYNDLFGADKYTVSQADAAKADFELIKDLIVSDYLGEDDSDFMIELKKKLDTLTVYAGIANDDVKDLKFAVVPYCMDLQYDFYAKDEAGYPENAFEIIGSGIASVFAEEYECAAFIMKYDLINLDSPDILDYSGIQTEALSALLDECEALNTHVPGLILKQGLLATISLEAIERYTELCDAIDTKNDTVAIELVESLKAYYSTQIQLLDSGAIASYDPADDYGLLVKGVSVRLAYLAAIDEVTALKDGNAKVDAVVDSYLDGYDQLDGIWEFVLEYPNTYDAVLDVIAEGIDRATKEVEFVNAIDKAIADITAMKNGDAQVDAAADAYIAVINALTFNYDNTANVNKKITNTVAAAQGETEFEKKRDEAISALTSNANTYIADDRYSEDGKKTISGMLNDACDAINALKYSEGKRINDIDAEIFKALANFKSVKVVVAYVGKGNTTYPDPVTELWGRITNENGFSGALKLSIKLITDVTDFKASEGKVVTGSLNADKAKSVIDGKKLAAAFKISLSDETTSISGTDNGSYTVRIFLPKSVRAESGLQVVSMDGDTALIYETVRAGAYLYFVVNDLGQNYYIIADKTVSLVWLVVLLAILVVVEIAVVVYFIIKKKKGATVAAFAPFLAVIYTPAGIVPAAITLGAVAAVGAIASTVVVVKALKKPAPKAADEAALDAADEVVDEAPVEIADEPVIENNDVIEEVEAVEEVEVVEEAATEPVEEIVEEVATEPVEEVAVEPVEEAAAEPVEEATPEVVEKIAEEPATETVTIVQADVEKEENVVGVVLGADVDDTDEEPALENDAEEDTDEDKKVFSKLDGSKVYVTYDYSFRSKLMLSTEEVQGRYALISDMLASYGMKCRESWKKERYFFKGKTYANIIFRGKTLCVCLAIDPKSLEGTKYFYEDVSATKKYESIPVMVRVRSGRGCKYALELIKMMFDAAGIEQKRDISDSFTYRTATKDELIEMGFIKVMMTDGHGEAVAADFNAMKTLDFSAGMPILKKVSVEEVAVVPDEEVAQFIETETDENNTGSGRRKGIVNIDSISAAYNAGDVVTLKSLKEKKLIAKNIDFVKVLARGTIDKSLTVKADDFSMDAVKMIIITGGTVIKLKKKA